MTNLQKNIYRESSETINNRNIIIALNKNQEIELKLKGLRNNKKISIGIKELYQLLDKRKTNDFSEKPNKKLSTDKPLINLHDFRSKYLISGDIPLSIKIKLEKITIELINDLKRND